MDLNKLKIFYYAAKSESYTNNELNLSPSVVSRHVSDLEYRLKAKLFHRNTRRLVLTPQGDILFSAAKNIMEEVSRAKILLAEALDEPQGLLTVTTPTSWSSTILVRSLSEFMKKNPKIRLNIISDDKNPYLFSAGNDVALMPYAPDQDNLIKEHIMTIHLGLFAHPSYLKEFGTPTCLEELDNHRLIAYADRDTRMSVINWHLTSGCRSGVLREPYLKANNLFDAAEQGLGIVCMAKENHLFANSSLVPVLAHEKAPKLNIYYVYPKHLKESKCVRAFGDFLRTISVEKYGESSPADSA